MDQGMNKKMNLGVPVPVPVPSWASETTLPPQIARLAPSNLPLLPSTGLNQVWKHKPYFVNRSGSSSGGTKAAYFKPLDGTLNPVALDQGDKKSSQHPSDTNVAFNGLPVTTTGNRVDATSQFQTGTNPDPKVDPKKLKRTISNRLSAQRTRIRKIEHIYDMEKRVKALEARIAELSPQVMFQQHQQKLLKMENYYLNQQIITCTENNMLKLAQLEEHKAEVTRLRQLHMTQQQQIQGQTTTPGRS